MNYVVDYRLIGESTWTKKDLFEVLPNARSVPQIFIEGEHVGGLGGLELYFMTKK
jgi:glutaredoxin